MLGSSALFRVGGLVTASDPNVILNFTERASGANDHGLYKAAWSPSLNLFVAVGDAGDIISSPDGITWTPRTSGVAVAISGLVWSPDLALFVAVSSAAVPGVDDILTSDDGETWTLQSSGVDSIRWDAIAWSPALSLLVTVGAAGKIATSPDGETWTEQTSGVADELDDVAWSPALGLFAALAGAGVILTSPDGITWTPRTAGIDVLYCIAWSSDLGIFVAGGYEEVVTSANGTAWTQQTIDIEGGYWDGVVWSSELGIFVMTGGPDEIDGDAFIVSSPDGVTWTVQAQLPNTAPGAPYLTGIGWSPALSRFVVVGQNPAPLSDALLLTGEAA